MKTNYIVEIEKAIEIRTNSGYLSPREIEEQIELQKYDEFFNEIATVETLEEARKIFDENKTDCISERHSKKIIADELRIREVNFDDDGDELDPDGTEIIDVYVAMLDGYVLSENGKAVDFKLATTYMDGIFNEVLGDLWDSSHQEIFTEYEKRHYEKFGEHFATAYGLECRKGL